MSVRTSRTVVVNLPFAGSDGGRLFRGKQRFCARARILSFETGQHRSFTARLCRDPRGGDLKRELYNYATVLKYQVLEVHRGSVKGDTIYVGHYNPFKPRSEASDRRVQGVGGNLQSFRDGQVHHMALEGSMLEHFTGGILNKYSEEDTDPIYLAVWTDLELVCN